jgi:peptidoglycan/xylan/chitin deacetylase (PgdA/CDA1 family)
VPEREILPVRSRLRPSMRIVSTLLALILFCCSSLPAICAGPAEVAVPHRDLWPEPINSTASFDRASRAEILVFAGALADSEALTADALKRRLHTNSLDMTTIKHVRERLWKILAENYRLASAGCGVETAFCPQPGAAGDLPLIAHSLSHETIEPRYRPWFGDATEFHRIYLDELLRLAGVFSRVSSEIDTYNDNEHQGWELGDRQFALTFDDGPSAPAGAGADAAETDRLLDVLRKSRVQGTFFVLGERFQSRLRGASADALRTLYSGMCVGSHGWTHVSHSTSPHWQDSVEQSTALIGKTLPDSYLGMFRPPYGQRLSSSGPYFVERGLKVVLWNIDSQDWHAGLTARDIEQRVAALMLLWRHGIILFHDIYERTGIAVPRLVEWSSPAGVRWVDCHAIGR